MNILQDTGSSPWQILTATILSLRTRDAVTLAASRRLFSVAPEAEDVLRLNLSDLETLIYPAAFFRTKARQLQVIATHVVTRGGVPGTRERLLELPGVGPKTASLVLGLAFGVPAICVDTHVHRIANRLGWISTTTPLQTEAALEALWPNELWIEANGLLVAFGQEQCTPISPKCSVCPLAKECAQRGVGSRR